MRPDVRARLRALSRRAGLGDVHPGAVAAAGVAFALVVAVAAVAWLPRGTQAATFANGRSASSGRSQASADGVGAARSPDATTVDPSVTASACVVHVVGAVRHPGVYELRPGQRVIDAVTAAGGMRPDAGQAGINLAAQLQDGEQVVVPTEDELAKGASPAAATGGAAGESVGRSGASGAPAGPIDINTADASALDSLPGVGPATAAKIVADRQANGPFKSADDLGRVPGIGPKKLEQLKACISVR